MPICEKCWGDAHLRYTLNPTKSKADHYTDILDERVSRPCTEEEQAGHVAGLADCGCRLCRERGDAE